MGLVGANDVGKSTLLRLLAGRLEPDDGDVVVQAATPPSLVAQDVATLADDVRAFGWRWDGDAQRLRRRLALDPDDLDPALGRGWHALSPGHRKRWQVAAALAASPDVLLLDEPTNHLDADARDLLVEVLEGFVGLGVLVSHDRAVLERLTARTVRLHDGALTLHTGSYGSASARWVAEEQARQVAHDRARREVAHERRSLADARRDRHSAQAGPRRERRLGGAAQPDAREAGRKFVQRRAEASLAHRVARVNARVDRAAAAEQAFDLRRDPWGAVGFHHLDTGRPVVGEVRGDVPHAGGGVLLRDVDVTLHRGERVRLAGANGAGKSTLLGALLDVLAGTDEQVGVLPQRSGAPTEAVAELARLDRRERGRVLGTVAALGVDPDRLLVTDRPSPGEARKLALARLLSGTCSVLLLDEPTNHLDLPSIERLQEALTAWDGAMVLVTHDATLAEAVTDTVWEVVDGTVRCAGGPVPRGR